MSYSTITVSGNGYGSKEKTLANVTIQTKVGESGTSPGNFKGPKGLAVEPLSQNIYIEDMLNGRIQVFSPSLQFLFLFPSERGVELRYPWGSVYRNILCS